MINSFSILHLSDIHYDNDKKEASVILVDKIIKDIENVNKKHTLNIKFLLLTGDLINFGGQKQLFEDAYSNIIEPILKSLNLTKNDFIYIPGNHELDRNAVNQDFQKAFIERINKSGVEKENFNEDNLTKRSKNYFDFINRFYNWQNNHPVYNIEKCIDSYNIGFSLYNTAWCSSTYSDNDVKKIFMPIGVCNSKSFELQKNDLRIALMHHPIDWFQDENGNDIQHILCQYDIVLCGHKHLENNNQEQKGPLRTFYNYANKLLPLKNNECGYSIINIFPNERKLDYYYREYNEKISEFSTGITDILQNTNGLDYSEYKIQNQDDELQNSFNVYSAMKSKFEESLDNLFITNSIDSFKKKFNNLYVDVVLTDSPEVVKANKDIENENKIKVYTFSEILNLQQNINIFGQKQSGKTVFGNAFAKYCFDNFEQYKRIPIVVDCKKVSITNINILKYINNYILDYVDDKYKISKSDINLLITSNSLILILDESNYLTKKQRKELDELSLIKININEENPLSFGNEEKSYITNEISDNKTNFYINPYRKNDIRKLVNNISLVNNDNKYIENIVNYFDTTSLPRTPFVISLIATICSSRKDVIPTNQAKILEQFLENVLEKINPIEQLSSTYDFNSKEAFLSYFAYEIYKTKSFFMTQDNFNNFLKDYHDLRGYSIDDSKFDRIFFEKNILENTNGKIVFRFECFNYYYLSKYAIKDTQFCEYLRSAKNNKLNSQILFYYTGLKRDDLSLLKCIVKKVSYIVEKKKISEDIFDRDPLKTNLGLSDERVSEVIESGSSIDEKNKDSMTDRGDQSIDYNPYMNNDMFNENENFEYLLSTLGFTIKNSEELTLLDKEKAFDIYLDGCEILWDNFRKQLLQFAKEINKKLNDSSSKETIDEELSKAYDVFVDLIRAIVPIAVSQTVFENSATEKMKSIYETLLDNCDYNTAKKMFLTFIISDLNVKNSEMVLNNFIKNTTNKNYLYVFLIKILFNYFYGTLEKNEKLINPIADCAIKVLNSPKSSKSKIIESLKKNKLPEKFLKLENKQKSEV